MTQSRKLIAIIAGAGAVIILAFLIMRSNNAGFSLVAEIPLDHASSSAASATQALVKKEPLPPPKILFSEIFPNPEGNDAGEKIFTPYKPGGRPFWGAGVFTPSYQFVIFPPFRAG